MSVEDDCNNLRLRLHGYPVSCADEECAVCHCDCDHCCFGTGPKCDDHAIVKTCKFPVDGRVQHISKHTIIVSEQDLHYLDLFFQLAQYPLKNITMMLKLIKQFPQFEFMSDDAGITVVDLIQNHTNSKVILKVLQIMQ
jgi:hypothetical protein